MQEIYKHLAGLIVLAPVAGAAEAFGWGGGVALLRLFCRTEIYFFLDDVAAPTDSQAILFSWAQKLIRLLKHTLISY